LAASAEVKANNNEEAFPAMIETAISLERPLSLTYIDNTGQLTQRTVEPHTFVWENHDGYLYAYCRLREDFRHFKLSGIQRLALAEGSFTHTLDLYEGSEELLRDNWEAAMDKIWRDDEDDEPYYDILFSCSKELLDEAFMAFGRQAKVLAPEEFKTLLKEKAQEVLQLY
jgi:predicted DNA-binding transcriptional regulator YafY